VFGVIYEALPEAGKKSKMDCEGEFVFSLPGCASLKTSISDLIFKS